MENEKSTQDFVIEVDAGGFSGSIALPDPDQMDGLMYNEFLRLTKLYSKQNMVDLRIMFYRAIDFVKKYGLWDISDDGGNPLTLEEAASWKNEPSKERVRFVAAVGKPVDEYFVSAFNPKKSSG